MCLILLGWRACPAFPLVLAANRDESYARPSAPAQRWHDAPQIIGGRDLEAGGTWLGVTDSGRFAAVTNVREPGMPPGQVTRGRLTQDFLAGDQAAFAFAQQIDYAAYAGFNLLLGDGETVVYCSNRQAEPHVLPPGIYGLSNHRLDTPWPKLLKARERFGLCLSGLPDCAGFFSLLADTELVPDELLPATGVPLHWERILSAVFVNSTTYGTRASTVLWQDGAGRIELRERSFGPGAVLLQSSQISTGV